MVSLHPYQHQSPIFAGRMTTHTIAGEEFVLLPQKAIWWRAKNTLILADLHFGKSMHFRKAGLPLPLISQHKDYVNLVKLLQTPALERVIFLGDLFHSHYNSDWELLGEVLKDFHHISLVLVQGNHDILHENHYRRFGFTVIDSLEEGPFLFTHEPQEDTMLYNIFGHIHPGVRLEGKGRQSLTLQCFFFSDRWAVVPSFGRLTGAYALTPKKTDTVFGIAGDKIVALK